MWMLGGVVGVEVGWCGAGLKTPFSHENGGLEDDFSLQGGHFPLP